jgi:hypothetical protein
MKRAAVFGSMLGLLLVAGAADAGSYAIPRPCANYRLNRDGGPQLLLQCLEASGYVTYVTLVDPTCPKTSWSESKDANGNITLTCKGPRLTR